MRYQMRQKMFSLGDDYTVQNDDGSDVYYIDGKAWSMGSQLSFQDMQRNELAFIRQKLLSWGQTYVIDYHAGSATVKQHVFSFNANFDIDLPDGSRLEASGNLTNHEYIITRDGNQAAVVSKQWFAMTDTYGVDVADGEDDVLMLAVTVVIDLCCHGDRRGK